MHNADPISHIHLRTNHLRDALAIGRSRCNAHYAAASGVSVRQGKSKVPVKQVSTGRRTGLALAVLTSVLCAGLYGCSDAAIVTAQVKLQQAAAADSEVLATIPKGSTVKVSDCTNGWCSASWNGREGYVLAKYVRVGNERSRSAADGPVGDSAQEDIPPGPESSQEFGPGD
jgi:hypothetical protein